MNRLVIIAFYCLYFSTNAQTIYDLKDQYIVRLTKMLNPNKDSIQKAKVKDVRNIFYKDNKTDTTIVSSYDKTGNILIHGNYSFRYDASDKVAFIRYYWSSRDEGEGFDSINFTKKLDTNKVNNALREFNRIFYDKAMIEVYKSRKKMFYYDSTIFDRARINVYCQINNTDTARYVSSINFQSFPHPPREENVIETVKYDYGYHPPSMQITRTDTLKKITKEYSYGSPEHGENRLSYTYRLMSIFTTKKLPDHNEYIIENYVGKDDKIFDFPQTIDIRKTYSNSEENYSYKKTSPTKEKLLEYYKITTYTTYYE